MMSIFSSFDALCAESFGHRIGFAFPREEKKEKEISVVDRKGDSSSAAERVKRDRDQGRSAPPARVERMQPAKQQRKPRFAPELDGLNCFETIIPY